MILELILFGNWLKVRKATCCNLNVQGLPNASFETKKKVTLIHHPFTNREKTGQKKTESREKNNNNKTDIDEHQTKA